MFYVVFREDKALEKTMKKVKRKYPDATFRQRELITRKYLMRRLIISSAIMYVGGTVLASVYIYNKDKFEGWLRLVIYLAGLIGSLLVIFGVCRFARGLHDPLTPQEAKELKEREEREKTGR